MSQLDQELEPKSPQQHEPELIAADAALAPLSLEALWPPDMDIEQASEALADAMARQGKKIVGNLRSAFFEKLEEALETGKELTAEQTLFFGEEGQSRKNNPLYQKPKPW